MSFGSYLNWFSRWFLSRAPNSKVRLRFRELAMRLLHEKSVGDWNNLADELQRVGCKD